MRLRTNAMSEQRRVSKSSEDQENIYLIPIIGMTFQVSIGFSALENADGQSDQSKIYALFVGDTVLVNEVKTLEEFLQKKTHSLE